MSGGGGGGGDYGVSMRLLRFWLVGAAVMAVCTAACPERCICLSETKVICNGAELQDLPLDFPDQVEDLNLSRNQLTTLGTEMFKRWRRLKRVQLNSNEIREMKAFVFKGLPDIKEISIQNNPLSVLPQFAFAGLENITQINLSGNRIATIEQYVFAGSRNIGMIILRENPLVRVKARAFSGLRTVQFIYMPSWVKVIESDAFFDLQGVGLLKLHSLDLHALRPFTFRGLRNVTQISIQESDLGSVRAQAFSGLHNVGSLCILDNKIDMLEELVVLEENNIDKVLVQGNHFLNLRGPRSFILEANQMTIVSKNYMPCSCQLLWVLASPVAMSEPLFRRHNYCVSPYSLHGSTLSEVDRTTLKPCVSPQELQQQAADRAKAQMSSGASSVTAAAAASSPRTTTLPSGMMGVLQTPVICLLVLFLLPPLFQNSHETF